MRLVIFLLLSLFGISGAAQMVRPMSLKPATIQQWRQQKHSLFLDQQHVNVPHQKIMGQISKLVALSCSMPCPAEAPLPVDGLKLEAMRLNKEKAELKWHTFSELNNYGFVVERSFSTNPGAFDSVGFVWGWGTTSLQHDYAFTDGNSYSGKTLYRIRQRDLNGASKYSNTVVVDGFAVPLSLTVVPNPAKSNEINLQFLGFAIAATMEIELFDSKGSTLFSTQHFVLNSAGRQAINGLNLAKGVYFIKAKSGEKTCSTTFLVN